MKTNSLYLSQLRAARRLSEFVNRHPVAVNIVITLYAIFAAYYVFMTA